MAIVVCKLHRTVRVFQPTDRPGGIRVFWDRKSMVEEGTTVSVGEPVTRVYDHRDKVAIPVTLRLGEAYLLFEELGFLDKIRIRELFPDHPLLVTVH